MQSTESRPQFCHTAGVAASEPALTGDFDRAGRRLGERQARRLLDDVRQSPERAAPATGERIAAFLVASAVHLLTAGLVVGGVALVWATWFDIGWLIVGVFLTTAGLAVLPRLERPPAGQRLRLDEVPLLHHLADDVADALAAPRVQDIVLNGDFNIGYAASGLTQRRVLVVGLPFWSVLDGIERVAVLAHEFGHAVSGDPSTSVVIGGALQTLRRWEAMLRPDRSRYHQAWARAFLAVVDPLLWVVALVPRGAHAALARLVLRDQQRCEYLSDVFGVDVAGRAAAAGALEKTLLEPAVAAELHRMSQQVAMRDVWEVLRRRADAVLAADRRRLLDDAAAQQVTRDATHPPTTLRLELVCSLDAVAPAVVRSRAEWDAIDAELAPLAGALGRALVGRYR
jgi:Zn-dependent protease with chaperone function